LHKDAGWLMLTDGLAALRFQKQKLRKRKKGGKRGNLGLKNR